MFVDSHCHLFDLKQCNLNFEEELKKSNVIVVSSSTDLNEFIYNEELAKGNNQIYLSYATHPQFSLRCAAASLREKKTNEQIELLAKLVSEKRITAIGECGFDLYNSQFKATENWQDEIFTAHLETAIKYDLPVILHVRRAMHKIFSYSNKLKKCKSVIFHSWPGTLEEGQALLRRGINAYFSFGNTILHGHKQQVRSCTFLPQEKILTETDAPYQPQKGETFSSWKDLPSILEKIASLRNVDSVDMETQIEGNFRNCLC